MRLSTTVNFFFLVLSALPIPEPTISLELEGRGSVAAIFKFTSLVLIENLDDFDVSDMFECDFDEPACGYR